MGDNTDRQRTLMIAMWARMSALFGVTWETNYGGVNEPTISAWGNALAEFTEEQLGRGIKACENWAERFPPNLPQFKKLCLTVNTKKQEHLNKYLLPKKRDEQRTKQAQSAFAIAAAKMGYLNSGKVDAETTPPISGENE